MRGEEGDAFDEALAGQGLAVVLNWQEEIKAKVPVPRR
jgi:hypothetical protein